MESLSGLSFFLAQKADSIFYFVLLAAIFVFIVIETVWVLKKSWGSSSLNIPKQHLEVVWSLIPAVVLFFLTFVRGSL